MRRITPSLQAVVLAGCQRARCRTFWSTAPAAILGSRPALDTAVKRMTQFPVFFDKRHLSASPPGFISPGSAKDLVEKERAVVIDVREEYEFAEGHASMAVNIAASELLDRMPEVEKLIGSKDRPVIVHCRSGGRSHMAMEFLQKAGYTKVYNLGGIINAMDAFEFWGSGSSVGPP